MGDKERFLAEVMVSIGGTPALLEQAGVTVIGHPERAENHVTSGYAIGEHLVISCDPAVESMLTSACESIEPNLEAWCELATNLHGELLGAVRLQLLAQDVLAVPPLPAGYRYETLNRDDAVDQALIAGLITRSSEEDLDESELDMDSLDEVIEVVIAPEGEIAAYASSGVFDMAEGFGDLAVLTSSEHRQRGLGTAAVASICARLLEVGQAPMYRCEDMNIGSVRLSASLGFAPVARLAAYRFSAAAAET